MSAFLDTALTYHRNGHPVIPVRQNKKPYYPGWDKWFDEPQTEEEVRELFSDETEGIAILLWPAGPDVVLDFDGPHAKASWKDQTKINLPETARNITQSGGEHYFYSMPSGRFNIKRKVRVIRADCDCLKECGVDLLIKGYALVPPTPGYSEDDLHPLSSAVPIPKEVLELAGGRTKKERAEEHESGFIRDGRRKSTLTSLAGTMRQRGMSIDSIRAALIKENEIRCDPPLQDEEIEDVLKSTTGWEPGSVAEPEHLTDTGNALRLVRHHGADLRYCNQMGWLIWTGKRWEVDQTEEIVRRAKATVRSISIEASQCEERDVREAMEDWSRRSESTSRIDAMIKLARSELPVLQNELDTNPWLLNVNNGTIDLRTGLLMRHDRGGLITKIVEIEYDVDATCPTWETFLERITASSAELIRFLQMAVGYSLTGLTIEQCLFILYGTGANGKSTFLNVLRLLVGGYAKQTRTETLQVKNSDQISNDVARLAGSRVVCAVEAENGRKLAVSLVKQMTGGDILTARFLNHEYFEFEPKFKIWLGVNHKPDITDTDDGTWRRIRLVPFPVSIPENQRDPYLLDKLKEELPGILSWAVLGCLLWQSNGLPKVETIQKATDEYRHESDLVGSFVEDCCEFGDNFTVTKKDLFEWFSEWCVKSGEKPGTMREFNRRIPRKEVSEARNNKSRVWKGIKLRMTVTQ
jgi:putative DNA primase/helicase